MAHPGWLRLAFPVDHSFCMFKVELGLLERNPDDEGLASARYLEDMQECASNTTKELLCHLIATDGLLAFSPKTDIVSIFASVRRNRPFKIAFPGTFSFQNPISCSIWHYLAFELHFRNCLLHIDHRYNTNIFIVVPIN